EAARAGRAGEGALGRLRHGHERRGRPRGGSVTARRGARLVRAPQLRSPRRIDTVVVGAGQAGLALSYYLTRAGHEHVLLERGVVGQRWHERWDSLTLLSPNWMNRLPGGAAHDDADGFLSRSEFVAYLEA